MEANEEKQLEYLEQIKDIEKNRLVYIDESGIDLNISKDKCWTKKGEVFKGKKSGKRYQRLNIIAGYSNKKCIATMMFNGSCDTELFNTWVEEVLIKEVKHGQTVVLDNASFHKSSKTRQLIESISCSIIFLPPYSPELNPIEKFWANMKKWIRERIDSFDCVMSAVEGFFRCASLD